MHQVFEKKDGLEIVPLWIDGGAATLPGTNVFPVFSAGQQKNVFLAQSANAETAIAAAECAQLAFKAWKFSTCAERRDIILRTADIIKARQKELIALQVEETSCSEEWAQFNITYTLNALPEIASRITTVCAGEIPPMAKNGTLGLLLKEAIGPVLLIAPWNAAVILAIKSLASIIGAGCTVVFKASEVCPRTHHFLVQAYIEAGLPANVISIIQAPRDASPAVTEALVAHKAIRKIEFIGSAAVGQIIGSLAGKYLKPVLMELGGKGASIVLEDANLEDAATKTIRSAFQHHGQVCFSTERIVVMQSIAEQFIEFLKKKAQEFPQCRGVSTKIVNNAYDMLVDAEKKGARFILGKPESLSETELTPALLTGVTKDMKIWDEESFGPSATIIVVQNDEELIEVVNESSYGLDAFVHTKDMKRAIEIARRLEVGRVRVNNPAHEATFPFNATKRSGWGSNNAGAGIEEFLVKKIVTLDFT